jgi:hypothetical protein
VSVLLGGLPTGLAPLASLRSEGITSRIQELRAFPPDLKKPRRVCGIVAALTFRQPFARHRAYSGGASTHPSMRTCWTRVGAARPVLGKAIKCLFSSATLCWFFVWPHGSPEW